MGKQIMGSWAITDIADLARVIEQAQAIIAGEPEAGENPVVYVGTDGEEPTQFGWARLIKTTLTDNSVVFDLSMSDA